MNEPANHDHANLLDRISIVVGRLTAWLTLFMVVVTFIVVVMRYVFDAGAVWLQESIIWMPRTRCNRKSMSAWTSSTVI